ncbi:DUF1508 domain-containing protein [uncultured Thiomicrorhabdus sp.]
MSNKPSWKDAPEDAKWLAQDECGAWYFYQKAPEELGNGFSSLHVIEEGSEQDEPNSNWKETLEKRPTEEVFDYPN